MSPTESYHRLLEQAGIQADPAQLPVVRHLQELHERLIRPRPGAAADLFTRLLRRRPEPVSGLYLWGGVGRGKTWLMDLFFHSLPVEQKKRTHFHRFMAGIHLRLDALRGQPDPLRALAADIARETRVLCLDEFQVWDIGDAMVLGGLLEGLFNNGLCLVLTSNSAPQGLYPDGLQRALFLPAIARLETHTRVIELTSGTDYRLRSLEQAGTYHCPLGEKAEQALADTFERIAPETGIKELSLDINGRPMHLRQHADSIAWLDFSTLCIQPRSRNDYLELARCYHTLLLSDIPIMGEEQNDRVKRFIHLVDVLYDHNVSLISSAEAHPGELYLGHSLDFEFRRTTSRLLEMQSREWLERPHLGQ